MQNLSYIFLLFWHQHGCLITWVQARNGPSSKYLIFSLIVRQWGRKNIYKRVGMNVKNIYISSTFLCLCPLNLSFKLNFNISKKAYCLNCPYNCGGNFSLSSCSVFANSWGSRHYDSGLKEPLSYFGSEFARVFAVFLVCVEFDQCLLCAVWVSFIVRNRESSLWSLRTMSEKFAASLIVYPLSWNPALSELV